MKQRVNEFVLTLSSFDSKSQFSKIYYNLLWKLYRLSLGKDYAEIKEVIFGQVALSIVLSSAFYEHARNFNPSLKSLDLVITSSPIKDLRSALGQLMKIDYKVALEITIVISDSVPPNLNGQVRKLAELGSKIVAKRVLLKRDFQALKVRKHSA